MLSEKELTCKAFFFFFFFEEGETTDSSAIIAYFGLVERKEKTL